MSWDTSRLWGHSRLRRVTVEECLTLSADRLTRLGLLRLGVRERRELAWKWSSLSDAPRTLVTCEVNTRDFRPGWLHLQYMSKQSGAEVNCSVSLATVPTPWGGLRWFFRCPMPDCGRRVGKLYLPPCEKHFGCRHCHDLTYQSCQESHRYDRLCGIIGSRLQMDPKQVERTVKLLMRRSRRLM